MLKLLIFSAVASSTLVNPAPSINPTQVPSWQPVQNYINANATYVSPGVVAMLKAESEANVKTWTIFSPSTSRKFDGMIIGWPAARVEMPSAVEAAVLSSMIDSYRLAYPH